MPVGLIAGKEIPANDFLKTGHGDPVGLAAYISSTKKNLPNYVRRMSAKIGTTGIPKNEGSTPVALPATVTFSVSRPVSDFFKTPEENLIVRVNIVTITSAGNPKKVAEYDAVVNWL